MRAAAAAAVFAVALAGCGNGPVRGVVKDTWHEPMEVHVTTTCSHIGKTISCHPQTTVDPEAWHLLLDGEDDEGKPDKGWRTVSNRVYDLCPAGTRYPECARWQAGRDGV